MGFDLVRFYLCPSSIERDTTEGVGIQEANFDTGNHRRDDFTPLETIQRTTKQDDDYNPYDDDLYESHDMSENLQAICDDLDITARGWKKKWINFDVFESIVI
ncbi:hypothetical protein Tco_1246872 [Tanacetum coccineum]